MRNKVSRVKVELNSRGIISLSSEDIEAILRGADELIHSGGRSILVKILKGSRSSKVLQQELDKCPVYGYFKNFKEEEILARVDWVIQQGYLSIIYDYKLPLLLFTPKGWDIERDTYSSELLHEFDKILLSDNNQYDMEYLKDRNRELIMLLLDKVEETGDKKYIPILEAWKRIEYKKVQQRIQEVVNNLEK